jgi:hypothetical protein
METWSAQHLRTDWVYNGEMMLVEAVEAERSGAEAEAPAS